jgi:PAS domain S-box-containing protein
MLHRSYEYWLAAFSVALATVTALLVRVLAAQKTLANAARHGEVQFQTLAEAIPQIVWTAAPDGACDYANKRWHELMRLTGTQSLGDGWVKMIHPDDRAACLDAWQWTLRTGETFELEYRLPDERAGFRWYLGRATPMRDSTGAIVKWFGTCTDIEEQKHNQQILEQQIKDRTEELADANTRLQEEMWEKDQARRQLDEQNEKMMHQLTERSRRATLLATMGELLQACVRKDEVFSAALGFAPDIFPPAEEPSPC